MATAAPIRIIHQGEEAGQVKASSSPVTTAEPSPMVMGLFRASSESTSAARQAATASDWTSRLRQPKI